MRTYSLNIFEPYAIRISSEQSLASWLEKLASIMGLDSCENDEDCESKDAGLIMFVNRDHECEYPFDRENSRWKSLCLKNLDIWRNDSSPDVYIELKRNNESTKIINMNCSMLPVYDRAASCGGLPFHAGLVGLDGKGFLLAADGNTGKTTSCSRLPKYFSPMSDDETLVMKKEERSYAAHPFPTWSDHVWKRTDRTWTVNESVPLDAVFFIHQSEADELVPLGEGESAALISRSAGQVYEKFFWQVDGDTGGKTRKRLFTNACAFASSVRSYRLGVSLEGEFWKLIESVLAQQEPRS